MTTFGARATSYGITIAPIDFRRLTLVEFDRRLKEAHDDEKRYKLGREFQDYDLSIGNSRDWELHGTPTVSSRYFQIFGATGSVEMGWGAGTEVNAFGEHANTGTVCGRAMNGFTRPDMNSHCALVATEWPNGPLVFTNKENDVARDHVYWGSSILTQEQMDAGLAWSNPSNFGITFLTAFNDADYNNSGSFNAKVRELDAVAYLENLRHALLEKQKIAK